MSVIAISVITTSNYQTLIPAIVTDQLKSWRQSRKLVLFIVFVVLFLDNMLLTTVVPIIPNVLYKLEHPELLTNTNEANRSEVSTQPPATTINNAEAGARHASILDENIAVGLLFASKAVTQFIANPFVGLLTNRIGYNVPMLTGFVIMLISTITFAFAQNYVLLFVARAVQVIGSACCSVSGMGMLAITYTDNEERGTAMGIALGGLALGVLVGPPYGGVMYQLTGKEATFLILAGLIFLGGLLQLFISKLEVKPEGLKGTSFINLLKDPYILLAAAAIALGNMSTGLVEPSLPLWMLDTMYAPVWQQGVVFLPACVTYCVGLNLFGLLAYKIGRWLCALIGMFLLAASLFPIPFCKTFIQLLFPNALWGVATAMVEASMMPELGHLADIRHVPVYGSVYAIANSAVSIGFAANLNVPGDVIVLLPFSLMLTIAVSGPIVKGVGFHWLLWIMSIIVVIFAPLLVFLRNPPSKAENQALVMDGNVETPVNYSSNNNYHRFTDVDDASSVTRSLWVTQNTDTGSTPPERPEGISTDCSD